MREDLKKGKENSGDSLREWATKHKRRSLIWGILLGIILFWTCKFLWALLFPKI